MSISYFCPSCCISLSPEQNSGYWLSMEQIRDLEDILAFCRDGSSSSFIGHWIDLNGTPLGICSNHECRFVDYSHDEEARLK